MAGRRGFTLIELLVVLAIIGTLLMLAVPRYFGSVERSKEAVLKENLFQLRDAISKYYADRGRYPESIEALASEKYLRRVPTDPDHRQHRDVGRRRAGGPAEGRRVRREKRRAGQGPGRDGLRRLVMRRAPGFTYLTVLFVVAFMGVGMAFVGEAWHTAAVREREVELLHVGNQYRKAIERYYKSGPAQYPRALSDLLKDPRKPGIERHLRSAYPDPVTGKNEWGIVKSPDGGVMGVYSLSEAKPFKITNFRLQDRDFEKAAKYADWKFVFVQTAPAAPTQPGVKPLPGMPIPAPIQTMPGTPTPGSIQTMPGTPTPAPGQTTPGAPTPAPFQGAPGAVMPGGPFSLSPASPAPEPAQPFTSIQPAPSGSTAR